MQGVKQLKRRWFFLLFIFFILVMASCRRNINDSASISPDKIANYDDRSNEQVHLNTDYIEDSFDIDIGDGIHFYTVLMRATPLEEETEDEMTLFFDSNLEILVYDIKDLSTPLQTFSEYTSGSLFKDNEVLDANFDGYNDFSYVLYRGNCN